MSRFISELEVILLDDTSNDGRGSWELARPLVYESDVAKQTFVVPAGYVTDFASVPRFPLTYMLFGDSSHEAAVIHDYLYSNKPVPRAVADAVLKEAAEVCGVPAWRRWGMYLGVRIGGSGPWNSDKPEVPVEPGALP